MTRNHLAVAAACLALAAMPVWAQSPSDAVAQAVATSGVFPDGTSVVSVSVDGPNVVVELSNEAVAGGLGDTQSDNMVAAINEALGDFPELTSIEVTVAGQPLWQYLPPATGGEVPPAAPADPMMMMAMAAPAGPTSSELAGKMIALHPSHGSYWHQGFNSWFRAMRTLCGPNPTPAPPGWIGSVYQPSNYYFYTRGYQWESFYEDDMSPETIRFLEAYLQSSGAEVWVSRNLDKNAGNFPVPYNGKYPNCSFPLPKWQTASKYYLEDRGDVPQWVWDEPALPAQTDKDLRARPYYANYRMTQGGYAWENCLSFSLHSNAAGAGTARGTETYWYTTMYPYLQTKAIAYCNAVEAKVINAIKNQYDGFWAEAMYPVGPNPPEWPTGTYRGYDHDGPSIPSTTSGWQDRGVKTTNFGEIREAKMPAQLMEVAFHDDWKFYPDHVFMLDQIWRSTVAWGVYEGMCQYWSITPKPRLAAALVSADFPAWVQPNAAIAGSVTMQDLGQAWCWGNKFDAVTKVYGPYTVWKLAATANEQIAPGTKIEVAQGAITYPGDTADFSIAMTAPAAEGTYTTEWRMLKDDTRGGAFGDLATAQIGVDGTPPVIAIAAPTEGLCSAASVAVQFDVTDARSGVASVAADVNGNPVNSGDTLTLTTGAYTLTVTATDNAGNTDTKTVSFNVDATAPVIVIGSPAAMDYPYGCVTVQFDATDEGCGGLASVTGKLDGNAVTSGQDVCGLALGAHTLVVTAVDGVGNTTTQSVVFNMINTPGKSTAGGWIELANKKGTCGLTSTYVAGDPAPTGNVTYQDHDIKMTVKSTALTAMGIRGNKASIAAECTIDGESGHWLRIDVTDNGEPGSNDVFNITLDTGYTAGGTLSGGNITIH